MENPGTPLPEVTTKKRSAANTPASDLDIKDLAQTIASSWKLNPALTLVWTDATTFDNTALLFGNSLGQRMVTGGGRAVVTNDLKNLDATINKHVDYLKDYLKEKYGKENYASHFQQFGIVLKGTTYTFPADRNKRNEALKQTLLALQATHLQDRTYGLVFWQQLSEQYDAALNLSISTDGSVAGLVKTKNEHKQHIVKTLNALIHILKGNYPDTYPNVMRVWGFQKEKY